MQKILFISDYIKNVQGRKKLNNEGLAEKLGITSAAVSRFRKNQSLPSPETCEKLADIGGDSYEKVFSILQISKAEKTGDVVYIKAWRRILKASGFMLGLVLVLSFASPVQGNIKANGAFQMGTFYPLCDKVWASEKWEPGPAFAGCFLFFAG